MKIAILSFFLVFSLISCNNYEKEIYLLPEHFHGRVNVVFNQKNGEKRVYENGDRIYKIPKDGVLVTQFEKQEGYMNTQYYFIDANNIRTPLRIAEGDELGKNEPGIYREGTRGVVGNSSEKNSFKYLEFYVTDKINLKNYFLDDSINQFNNKVRDKVMKINAHE
jgi:hypothetical protein